MDKELRLIITRKCNYDCYFCHGEGVEKNAVACLPIISAGDVTGAVAFLDDGSGAAVNHCQKTLIQAASQFLGKQLES